MCNNKNQEYCSLENNSGLTLKQKVDYTNSNFTINKFDQTTKTELLGKENQNIHAQYKKEDFTLATEYIEKIDFEQQIFNNKNEQFVDSGKILYESHLEEGQAK